MNSFLGDTANSIYREVDRWQHLHPGEALPPYLYRALLKHGKPKTRPTTKGLDGPQQQYDHRLTQSWHLDNNVTLEEPIDARVGLGLSNGAYHAGHVLNDIPPVDNKNITNPQVGISGLKAWFEVLPGTLWAKVRGNVSPRPINPDAKRGEISKLTRSSLNRLTACTRELEALEYKPGYLLTLTYPGNWRGALASAEAQDTATRFRVHWQRIEDLRSKLSRAREALRYNRTGNWVLQYLLDEYKNEKFEAKKLLATLRTLGPDGKKVKEHKNAFLKRFERAFGTQVISVHRCYAQALKTAKEMEESNRFVAVKVRISDRKDTWRWETVGVLYRAFWWMEFQKRGAPHLHMIFFDVREGIDWQKVRLWAGYSWAGVVAGIRSAKCHDPAHNSKLKTLLENYDHERDLWGKDVADTELRRGVTALGLDWQIFQHVRAGTNLEKMRKGHWGYAAKEASKYTSKKYQSKIPKNYKNVGRWWGYSKYQRATKYWFNVPIQDVRGIEELVIKPLQAATSTLPPGCFRFKQKIERFFEAARNQEPYGYITVWGHAAVEAALEVMT